MPLWSRLQRPHTRPPLRTRNEAPRYIDDTMVLERLFRERPDPWDFLTDPYEQACLTHLGGIVQRVPHASVLEVGCAEGVFDLVVCAETLYYMSDPAAALVTMRQLGQYVFVSYTRHERQRLDPLLVGMPAVVDEEFTYVVRRFPPKKRGCRSLVWGPLDSAPSTLNTSWAPRP